MKAEGNIAFECSSGGGVEVELGRSTSHWLQKQSGGHRSKGHYPLATKAFRGGMEGGAFTSRDGGRKKKGENNMKIVTDRTETVKIIDHDKGTRPTS